MAIYLESRLQFSFDDAYWNVILKVDGHIDHRNAQVLPQFKIVDFVCSRPSEVLFVEVKNFNGYSVPPNTQRLLNSIATKVKDTISCTIAANINSTTDQANWNYLTTQLTDQNVSIKVVFWMEDAHSNILRAKAGASVYENILKKKLRWLTTNAIVTNTLIGGINGLTVV